MLKKKIIVLGGKGMLGNQVTSYFKKKYKIIKINKSINRLNIKKLIYKINNFENSIIINCIGKIKQKKNSEKEILFSNTILPTYLALMLKKGHLLVHPSTDCVFDGKKKKIYTKQSEYSANDIYGVSKYLADEQLKLRKNTLIIRVSIIGISKNGPDLLTWALKYNNKKLYGYIDHYWNGVTTLEWCKILEKILNKKKQFFNSKLLQIGTKKCYSKYEILHMIKNIFNLKFNIIKMKAGYINRCLKTDIHIKDIFEQLLELKKYWKM